MPLQKPARPPTSKFTPGRHLIHGTDSTFFSSVATTTLFELDFVEAGGFCGVDEVSIAVLWRVDQIPLPHKTIRQAVVRPKHRVFSRRERGSFDDRKYRKDLGLKKVSIVILFEPMATLDDILKKMAVSPQNIRFSELCRVCEAYFGSARQSGSSHRIYKTPWQGDPRVNIQNSKGKAKPYQVKQVLKAIERLNNEAH